MYDSYIIVIAAPTADFGYSDARITGRVPLPVSYQYYPVHPSTMFIDLNVPVPILPGHTVQTSSKKGKGKPEQNAPAPTFTPAQITAIESRIDLLVQCQYSLPNTDSILVFLTKIC